MAFLKSPNDDDVRKICSIRFNLAENKNKNIMDNEKIVDVLNDLLQITNDRIKGFSKVEDKVWEKYSSLKGDYDHMVSESQQMKTELHELIRNKGGEPDDSGTVLGSIHRGWIDVKNALVGDKAESTLENVYFPLYATPFLTQWCRLCLKSVHNINIFPIIIINICIVAVLYMLTLPLTASGYSSI